MLLDRGQPARNGPANRWRIKMNIIGWLLFGLIVGAIAKFLMPGRDPGGWIVTILLGVAGSFVGGFLATTLMGQQGQTAGWIGSIIGAMLLLLIYRLVIGRRTTA
ncbi:MAG TPA: GlsB/YeaQ/YmgE family stress response membrane protein [Thermoanaerobaculia bacterium]|nr:GlsB/YeaQ/YmgE family stress response membrane protein [Thermoanaerobaculia bacterium]